MNEILHFYVRPGSGDAGDGSPERPFCHIPAAQAAVRAALRGGHEGEIHVVLGGGVYELREPLKFGTADAGGSRCRVTYRSAKGETPKLFGGIRLVGWELYRDGIWQCPVPEGMRFETLYADGERVRKARLPASGYFLTAAKLEDDRAGFVYEEGDVPELEDIEGIQAYVWPGLGEWNWFTETIPVGRIDARWRSVAFARSCTWGVGAHSRYYLQGSLAFLREPGQFHLDAAAGVLYYRPARGTPQDQAVVAPCVMRLLDIQGDAEDRPVCGLTFRGLALACSDFMPDHRMMRSEPNMANAEPEENRSGLVYIRDAEDIGLHACDIRESGTCGVFIDRSARRITVSASRIERVGHTAVYASGYAPGEGPFADADDACRNCGHFIADNVIARGGELVGHGSGIVLYQCGDAVIAHNRIFDMPRYGISLKGLRRGAMSDSFWQVPVTWDNHWDFLYTRNNLILGNDISNVMTDSQDGGMIEAWGIGRGNRISGNRLHHSGIHFSFGFGIYLDDAADDVEVTHNVLDHLYASGTGCLWMTIFAKGIGNRIVNNLIVDNPDAVAAIGSQEMAGEANRDLVIERNIVCNSGHLYNFVNWSPERFRSADFNLFWNGGKPCMIAGELPLARVRDNPVRGGEYDWTSWRTLLNGRYDRSTLIVSPGFADADEAACDYRLDPASPAHGLGWEPVSLAHAAGPRPDPEAPIRDIR